MIETYQRLSIHLAASFNEDNSSKVAVLTDNKTYKQSCEMDFLFQFNNVLISLQTAYSITSVCPLKNGGTIKCQ